MAAFDVTRVSEHGARLGVHRIKGLRKKFGLRSRLKREFKATTNSKRGLPVCHGGRDLSFQDRVRVLPKIVAPGLRKMTGEVASMQKSLLLVAGCSVENSAGITIGRRVPEG